MKLSNVKSNRWIGSEILTDLKVGANTVILHIPGIYQGVYNDNQKDLKLIYD